MATKTSPGIDPSILYTLTDFQRLTGLGRWAMRQARRKGLRVRRIGGRAYVLGSDFVAHLDAIQAAESAKEAAQ